MDLININLDEIDDGTDPIPDQAHVLWRNTDHVTVIDKNEFPYINIQSKPVAGQVDPKHQNKSVWTKLSYSPRALWHMKAYLKGVGITSIMGKRPEEVAEMLKGREFYADVATEVGQNGNKQNKFVPSSYRRVG